MDAQTRPEFFRRAIRRRWRVGLVAILLGLIAVPAYLGTTTTAYRATSVVFLEPSVGNPYSPTTLSSRQEQLAALTTEAGLLLTDSVAGAAQQAGEEAGVDLGSRIQERTVTEVPSNSQVVHVSFTADDPHAAQFGAQALANAYLEYRQSRSAEVTETQLTRLDQEIASLSTLMDNASRDLDAAQQTDAASVGADVLRLQEQLRIYANQLGQLRIERVNVESASTSPGEVVSPAQLPAQPEGLPATLVATAIVIALLGVGLVAAVVLEHLDSRLRSPDEIERMGIAPVFGPAPVWRPELSGTAAEDSYRLAMLTSQRGIHGLLGATTAVPASATVGLVKTLADIGHSVVIVLVTPNAAADAEFGLSDALHRECAPGDIHTRSFASGIHLVSAGTTPEDLGRLVHRPVFPALIKAFGSHYDVVILVGEAAQSGSGAAVISLADRAILVARAGETREDELLTAARAGGDFKLGGVLFMERSARRWLRRVPDDSTLSGLQALLGTSLGTGEPSTPRESTKVAASTTAANQGRNSGS